MVQIPHVSKWFMAHTLYCKVLLFCNPLGSLQAKGGAVAWQKLPSSPVDSWNSQCTNPCVSGGPQNAPGLLVIHKRNWPRELSTQVYSRLWLTTSRNRHSTISKRKRRRGTAPEQIKGRLQESSPGGAAQTHLTPVCNLPVTGSSSASEPRRSWSLYDVPKY